MAPIINFCSLALRKLHLRTRIQPGFSLLEVIVVLILLAIVAAVIGPFIGNILGNYIQSRNLVEREQQASLILERFVRDVRMSIDDSELSIHNCTSNQILSKKAGTEVKYEKDGQKLFYQSANGKDYLLSKYIDNVCFEVKKPSNATYKLVKITFDLQVGDDNTVEFKAAAVPRWE